MKSKTKTFSSLTKSQGEYAKLIHQNHVTFCLGAAGTGKTFVPAGVAAEMLYKKEVQQIILVRPAVEAGENLGFLPGGPDEKLEPYMVPLKQAFQQNIGAAEYARFRASGQIQCMAVAYMRGVTFDNSFVIADEAQNMTKQQLKMLLTRLGEGSKIVVAGDPDQCDLPNKGDSGFSMTATRLEGLKGIGVHKFSDSDIVRHPLIGPMLKRLD